MGEGIFCFLLFWGIELLLLLAQMHCGFIACTQKPWQLQRGTGNGGGHETHRGAENEHSDNGWKSQHFFSIKNILTQSGAQEQKDLSF